MNWTEHVDFNLSAHENFPSLFVGEVLLKLREGDEEETVGGSGVRTICPFDEKDLAIGEAADFSGELSRRARSLKPFLSDPSVGEDFYDRMVTVMNVKVDEPYRGNGLGYKIMESVIRMLPKPGTIFTICPKPIEESEDNWSKEAYVSYWKDFGFRKKEFSSDYLFYDCYLAPPEGTYMHSSTKRHA